jgi:hypothetical protein
MTKHRQYNRTENDDLILNVLPYLDKSSEAIPFYSSEGVLLGWRIKSRFE